MVKIVTILKHSKIMQKALPYFSSILLPKVLRPLLRYLCFFKLSHYEISLFWPLLFTFSYRVCNFYLFLLKIQDTQNHVWSQLILKVSKRSLITHFSESFRYTCDVIVVYQIRLIFSFNCYAEIKFIQCSFYCIFSGDTK